MASTCIFNTTHIICGYINPLTPSHVFSQGITPHAAGKQPIYKNSWRWIRKCPKHVEAIYENKVIVKLFASSWYIFLTYIYDARSHLHKICFTCKWLITIIHKVLYFPEVTCLWLYVLRMIVKYFALYTCVMTLIIQNVLCYRASLFIIIMWW